MSPLSWFLGTLFSFPEMQGPIQDRGGALENTHTLAQVPFFLLSAVVGSVLKQYEHHASKVKRSFPPKDRACLLALSEYSGWWKYTSFVVFLVFQ